ncbi:hypothetical protein C4K27_2940 [Pseudomonas chlororaphis subsp. chlororaphis]|nr:hypothetical protein C4K27_2940 [Pseudomonas chlororaphis subsp. chlororaphis]
MIFGVYETVAAVPADRSLRQRLRGLHRSGVFLSGMGAFGLGRSTAEACEKMP